MNPWLVFVPPLLWSFGVFLAARGVGRIIFRGWGFRTDLAVAEEVFSLGLGLAVLSYIIFALACLHALSPAVLKIVSMVWIFGGLLLFFFQRPVFRNRRLTGWEGVILAAMGITAALNLLYALTPAVDWDGLAYHLALPKIYLEARGFVFRPDIFHNLFPQFTEMLYLAGQIFPYGIGPKLLHFGFGLLAAGAVFACCRVSGLKTAAWLGAAVFYLQFIVHIESSTAFIDLAAAAYVGLALLAFLIYQRQPDSFSWLYLGFFFLGVDAAVKWHGLILLALAGCLVLVKAVQERRNFIVQRILGITWWGALPVAPYLIRAWVMSGNPVWPLGYRIFRGRYWNQAMADQVSSFYQVGWTGLKTGLAGFWRLPYDLLAHGSRFGVGGLELQAPIAGGFLLLLFGIRQWTKPEAAEKRWGSLLIGASGLIFLWIWFQSSPQIRFLLPLFPILAWLAALALHRAWQAGKSGRVLAIAAGLLLFAIHPAVHRDTPYQFRALMGKVPAADFITRYLPHYPACQYLNQTVQPGEKILLFGENRGFYLNQEYLWGDPFGQCVVDYRQAATAASLLARLHELGIQWILFRTDLYDERYLDPKIVRLMETALAQAGEPTARFGPVLVYRLKK